MDKLSRFFKGKRDGCLQNTQIGGGSQFYVKRPFDGHQIRLVVFKDHDVQGRRTVYDSSHEESQKAGECQGKTGPHKVPHALCKAVRERCNKQKILCGNSPAPPGNQSGRRRRLSSDSTMLSEMVFGSAPMLHKASTMKVHKIRTPPQLMITQVFIPNTGYKDSRDSNNSCTSLMDSMDSCSVQTEASSEAAIPKKAGIAVDGSTPLGQSVPMMVPVRKITNRDNEDSGISESVASSISSHTSTPYHSHDSASSTPSSSLSSFQYSSRLKRHMDTSLQYLDNPMEEPQEPVPISKRPPKIGVGVIFGLPGEDEEGYSYFRSFFFSHVTLIEGHVHKLIAAIDTASKRRCRSSVTEALEHFRSSMVNLYTACRLPEPVWLNLMCRPSQRVPLCDKFLREFMTVVEKCDTKNSRLFMSSLLTGVLSNHLAWVPTVTPAGSSLSSTYLVKHSATWVDSLAKSHPYNPLWAQLSDLYGAIGTPLQLSRTLVTGKKNDLVSRLLYVISYFIRCSELQEITTIGQGNVDCKEPYASLFVNDRILQDCFTNSVRSSANLSSCKSETQMEPPAYLEVVKSPMQSPVPIHDSTELKTLNLPADDHVDRIELCTCDDTANKDLDVDPYRTALVFQNMSPIAEFCANKQFVSPSKVEDWIADCNDNDFSDFSLPVDLSVAEVDLSDHPGREEDDVFQDNAELVHNVNDQSPNNSLELQLTENELTAHTALLETVDVSLSEVLDSKALSQKVGSTSDVADGTSKHSAKLSTESSTKGEKTDFDKSDLNLIETDIKPIEETQEDVSTNVVQEALLEEQTNSSSEGLFRETTSQIIEEQHIIRTRLVGRHIEADKENCTLDNMFTPLPIENKHAQNFSTEDKQCHVTDSLLVEQDTFPGTGAREDFDEYFTGDSPGFPDSVHVTPKLSIKPVRPECGKHISNVWKNSSAETFAHRPCLLVDPALFDEYFSDAADAGLPHKINLEVEKEVNKCFREQDPEAIPKRTRPKLARIALNGDPAYRGDRTCAKERLPLPTDSTAVKEGYPIDADATLVKGSYLPPSGITLEPSWNHHIPLPLLDPPGEVSESIPGMERNFGRSLMAGYSERYLSDFALHGTNDPSYLGRLHGDLTLTMAAGTLDQDISAAACVLADTDQWSVRLLKCERTAPDRIKSHEIKASKAICDMLESVHLLWKMKTSPEFCLMHLEDRLQELYFKSRILAEFLVTNQAQSSSLDSHDLAMKFGFHESDLPLLLAVAGTLVAPL